MQAVLVNRLGGLSLPRKSVVRLTDRPDMTLDVYRGRKTTIQQQPSSNGRHLLVQFLLPLWTNPIINGDHSKGKNLLFLRKFFHSREIPVEKGDKLKTEI